MPIYEYECEACQARFEALVPYEHRDDVACELCGEAKAARLASVFASTSSDSGPSTAFSGGSCCGGSCSCCGD